MAHGHSHHSKETKHHSKKHKAKGGVMKGDTVEHAGAAVDNEYKAMHEFSKDVHSGKHAKKMCHGGKM